MIQVRGETMFSVILFIAAGEVFILMGIKCRNKKEPVGFWANSKKPAAQEVNDVEAYNKAVGMLWIVYGLSFAPLSLPLVAKQTGWIVITVLGVVFMTLFLIVRYMMITDKYLRG